MSDDTTGKKATSGKAGTRVDPDAAENGRDGRERDAGQDESIARRLERNPESQEARLDTALDQSMDASDPPSAPQDRKSRLRGKREPVRGDLGGPRNQKKK